MSSLLELIRGRKRERASGVVDLAKRVADGERVDLDRIEDALLRAGMEPEEFDTLTELCRQRAAWRKRAAGLPGAEREAAATQAKIDAEDAKLAAARRAHESVTEPMYETLRVIESRILDCRTAHGELASEHNVPEALRTKRREAARAHEQAAAALRTAKASLATAESHAEGHRRTLGADVPKQLSAHEKGLLQHADALAAERLRNAERTIARLAPEVADLARREAEARAALTAADKAILDF